MINSQTINRSNLNLHCGNVENYKRNPYGISGKTENAFFAISVVQEGIFKIPLNVNNIPIPTVLALVSIIGLFVYNIFNLIG